MIASNYDFVFVRQIFNIVNNVVYLRLGSCVGKIASMNENVGLGYFKFAELAVRIRDDDDLNMLDRHVLGLVPGKEIFYYLHQLIII